MYLHIDFFFAKYICILTSTGSQHKLCYIWWCVRAHVHWNAGRR